MGSCNSIRSFLTLILLTGLPVIVCAGNHHAVVLEENNVFTVEDINQAEYKRHVRLLIRDKNGLEYTRVSYTDGRYYRCEDVSAFITDTTGEKLKELDTDDIHRSNITPEISDRWEYWFDLTYTSFPFILEYTISYEFHSLFFWPDWSPAWEIPVSESQYILNLEDDIAFSWYNIGIDIHPDTVTTGPARTLVWRMENIEPLKKEDLAPPEAGRQPMVLFKPEVFQIEDHTGRSATWDEFGAWIRALYRDKYRLTEETETQIKQMIAPIQSERERIAFLYNFVQNRTRYVAIELGIGGWQPYDAQWVFDKCYGDCKDLTTLMIGLLKAADITAFPALVQTRDRGIVYTDFPWNQFNHVITCVPLEDGPVWLETTADYIPAGELPPMDEGCDVLVITDSTAEFIRTPESTADQNRQFGRFTGKINPAGAFEFEGHVCLSGNDRWRLESFRESKNSDEFRKFMLYWFGQFEGNLSLGKYTLNETGKHCQVVLEGTLKNFVNRSRKRIFLNPNILNRITTDDIPDETERKHPVFLRFAYSELDTIEIQLPFGTILEAAPEPAFIDNEIGYYRSAYNFSPDRQLTYIREFACKKRFIPLDQYQIYTDFLKTAADNDNRKFVFVKQ